MDINTAQLQSAKPDLKFCAGWNPACGALEIHNSEDLSGTMVLARNKAEHLFSVNHTTKEIHDKGPSFSQFYYDNFCIYKPRHHIRPGEAMNL